MHIQHHGQRIGGAIQSVAEHVDPSHRQRLETWIELVEGKHSQRARVVFQRSQQRVGRRQCPSKVAQQRPQQRHRLQAGVQHRRARRTLPGRRQFRKPNIVAQRGKRNRCGKDTLGQRRVSLAGRAYIQKHLRQNRGIKKPHRLCRAAIGDSVDRGKVGLQLRTPIRWQRSCQPNSDWTHQCRAGRRRGRKRRGRGQRNRRRRLLHNRWQQKEQRGGRRRRQHYSLDLRHHLWRLDRTAGSQGKGHPHSPQQHPTRSTVKKRGHASHHFPDRFQTKLLASSCDRRHGR